jgi:protoporphyrinogen oxidase
MTSNPDVIIVGAGIGGLTAADTLRRAGKTVLVLEASDRPGGRVVKITRKGDAAEAGAQGIHSNYDEMLAMIDRFGLTGDLMPASGKVQYLDRSGAPRVSGSNRDLARIVGARGAVDLVHFWTRYFTFAKRFSQFELTRDIPRYDDVSAEQEFRWAGQNFRDFVMRPMCHAMANATPASVSLYYVVNALRIRMTTRIFGLRHGNVSILERMAETLPVSYGSPVSHVLTKAGAVEGVALQNGTSLKARHVILACTAGGAGKLLTDEFRPATEFLNSFTHTPMPLVFFFLDRPLDKEAYSFMGHPYRDVVFNMALDHARKTPYLVPSGKAIISAWPAYPFATEMAGKPDSDVINHARNDLEAFFPGFSEWIDEARVFRHSWGVARYGPGMHGKVLDFKRYAQTLKGLSFAGTDYDSIHMESGVRSGQRAAMRALQA